MKKVFLPIVILLIFALAACGGANQEELVERASTIAENVVDTVTEELSGPQEEACVIADIPAPSGQNVMVRFVNKSNGEVSLVWRDNSQSPFQLTEYTTLADGEAYDQPTFVDHEWLLMDEEGTCCWILRLRLS